MALAVWTQIHSLPGGATAVTRTDKSPLKRLDFDKDSGIGDPLTASGFRSKFSAMAEGGQLSGGEKRLREEDVIGDQSKDAEDHPWTKVTINVCGTLTETYFQVIDRFPQTILGDPSRRKRFWDSERKEFYFDTHAGSFEAIFQWYQTGILQKPEFVPMDTFLEQLDFFGIDQETKENFQISEGMFIPEVRPQPTSARARFWWNLFEYPDSSIIARLVGVASSVFIFGSLAVLCLETLPRFHGLDCVNVTTEEEGVDFRLVPNYSNPFFLIETVCIAWFTVEYIIRLITCPSKKKFALNKLNGIDIITILPYFVMLFVMEVTHSCKLGAFQSALPVLRILRAFRVFKLTRQSHDLQVLMMTLRSSLNELGVSLMFLLFGATFSAFVIYLAEAGHPDSQINSVAEGLWWAVATMTTVGYGDVVPVRTSGRLVGAACVVLGALVLALPAPIIVTNFTHFYKNRGKRN